MPFPLSSVLSYPPPICLHLRTHIRMKAATERADLVEGEVDLNPLLVEEMEYRTTRKGFDMPNRQLWPWIVHSILFSTALIIIYMNQHTGTDCIQKLSYYCTPLIFLFCNLVGLIEALYQPRLSPLSTKTIKPFISTTRIILFAVRPPRVSAKLGID